MSLLLSTSINDFIETRAKEMGVLAAKREGFGEEKRSKRKSGSASDEGPRARLPTDPFLDERSPNDEGVPLINSVAAE